MQSLKDEIAQLQTKNAELEVIVEQQKAEIATLQQKVIIVARTRLMVVDSAVLAQQSGRSSQQA